MTRATCIDGMGAKIPAWHRWVLAPFLKPGVPCPPGGWQCETPAPTCSGGADKEALAIGECQERGTP